MTREGVEPSKLSKLQLSLPLNIMAKPKVKGHYVERNPRRLMMV
jgi:hypothetical protein